jgi:hypothetical protein
MLEIYSFLVTSEVLFLRNLEPNSQVCCTVYLGFAVNYIRGIFPKNVTFILRSLCILPT